MNILLKVSWQPRVFPKVEITTSRNIKKPEGILIIQFSVRLDFCLSNFSILFQNKAIPKNGIFGTFLIMSKECSQALLLTKYF